MVEYKLYHGAWISKEAPHKCKKICKDYASELLKEGGWFVRNTYDFDMAEERQFWYIIKNSYGGIEELPSKVRNQVRKSQRTYAFRKVDAEEMIEKGYELYNQSRERFGNELKVTYEEFSKLFVNTVQDNRKDFKAIGNDFIKSFNEITKKLSKTSNKDLTIYELADLLKDNGKTFAKVKENMDTFTRGINNLQAKDESNDNELKELYVKMTSMGNEFTKLLTQVQSLLKYSKDSIIIFKVYIAFLEYAGSRGYVDGHLILPPEIGLDKVHLVQFMKRKEWRHYKHPV